MNIFDVLKANARDYSNHTAIVFDGLSVTYAELFTRICSCISTLRNIGVRKGSKVTLLVSNGLEFIIHFFAVTRIGAIANPLSTLLTEHELLRIFQTLQPEFIITDESNTSNIQKILDNLGEMIGIVIPNSKENNIFCSTDDDVPMPVEQDDMAIFLSSGTTDNSKFVVLSHKTFNTSALLAYENYRFSLEDRLLMALPLPHMFGGNCLLGGGLIGRTTLIIESSFKVSSILEQIIEQDITIFAGVPTQFYYMTHFMKSTRSGRPNRYFKYAISGGNILSEELAQSFYQLFGVQISNLYGCTEVGFISGNQIDSTGYKKYSVGKAHPSIEMRILDDNGVPLGVNMEGELAIKADHIAPVYLENGERVHALGEDGFFHTGDLAKIDENGVLYVLGRLKDIIISGGYNVNPHEVEEVIRFHPNVKECTILGVPDDVLGEIVVAVVVPYFTQDDLKEQLQELCRQKLAKYKQPQRILVYANLPKTSIGKVKKPILLKEILALK